MALRPIDFAIPRREPSVIEDAFRVALSTAATALISEPFQKRAQARESAATLALRKATMEQELQALPTRLAIEGAAALKRQEEEVEQEIKLFPKRASAQFLAQMAVREEKGKIPVTPTLESTLDHVRMFLGHPAGEIAKPTSLAEYEEIAPILSEAVQAETSRLANLRQGEQLRDQRLAGLIANLTPEAWQKFGNYVIKGKDGAKDEPISPTDVAYWTSAGRIEILKNDPTMKEAYDRYKVLQQAQAEGRFVPSRILTQERLDERTRDLTGPNGLQELPALAFFADRTGILFKDRKRITDLAGEGPAFLKINEDLMQALIAFGYYRDMQDVINAEKLQNAAPLSTNALGYLQRMYRTAHKTNWHHPDATESPHLPPSADTQTPAGPVRINIGGARRLPPGSLIGETGGPLAGFAAATKAVPSTDIVEGKPTELYDYFFKRFSVQGANLDSLYTGFSNAIAEISPDPDSAAAFFRKAGIKDLPFMAGDAQKRKLALNEFIRKTLGDMRDARDRVLTQP